VFHLDMHGVYIATGAACTANKATRIPALEAIGLTSSQADGSLRITLGHLNRLEDVPVVAKEIADAIAAERML
jgi:cysteine desulfurase